MFWGAGLPVCEAPSWVPFHDASLNDLSSRVPTSVTMPIFSVLPPDAPGLAGDEHAETTMASPAMRASANERVRMFPPPTASMPERPLGRAVHGSPAVRRSATHAGAAIGAHPSGGASARQPSGRGRGGKLLTALSNRTDVGRWPVRTVA